MDNSKTIGGHRVLAALEVIAGLFGPDIFIQLLNSALAKTDAVHLKASFVVATAGNETGQYDIFVVRNGVFSTTPVLRISGQGIVLPGGLTPFGLTIGTQVLWDDLSGNFRIGLRGHFWGNDAIILNPFTQANAAFYLDTNVAGGIHQSGVGIVALKGGGSDRFFASAVGASFNAVTTPVAAPSVGAALGAALTDGTTGGTANTLTTFAGAVYATDAPIILGDIHQLAIKVAAMEVQLKALTACLKANGLAVT